jgi:hypothetical protein
VAVVTFDEELRALKNRKEELEGRLMAVVDTIKYMEGEGVCKRCRGTGWVKTVCGSCGGKGKLECEGDDCDKPPVDWTVRSRSG